MNEAELAERCGKGDNLARKQLYERYAGQLMAICIRYIGDRETAQDVLHDGFLNIFRSFDKFTYKGEGSLKAWQTVFSQSGNSSGRIAGYGGWR